MSGDPILPSCPFTATELRDFLRANPDCERIHLFSDPSLGPVCAEFGFVRHIARPVVSLDLARPEAMLWAELRDKRRNGIRYARKHGVVVEVATPADLDSATRLFLEGYAAKYGVSAESICPSVGYWIDRGNLLLARLRDGGPVIAGVASLDGHDLAGSARHFRPGIYSIYSANSSRVEYQKYKPNDLLVWEAALRAQAAGYRHYVLGSQEARFKSEFSRGHVVVDEWVRRKSLAARLVARILSWPPRPNAPGSR